MYKRIILFILFPLTMLFAQDQIPGSRQITIPENIQSLYNAINAAENNGDWNSYNQLRNQIITEWQKVDPEIAKLYRNVSDGVPDQSADGEAGTRPHNNIEKSNESIPYEIPKGQSRTFWGDDKMITGGKAYDISMDISRDGDIYIAVSGRLDGSTNRDTVYIYKSDDGGVTWTSWSKIFASTHSFKQVELMCFDGFPGSTGDSYLLLFFLFDDGWLRVGRTPTDTPSWSYYTIVGSSGSNYPTDFAVDRNYPSLNYRAICLYDSLNIIKSVRSDPASYGTVWQDAVSLGLVGKDLDLCYGYNGGTYASFNGFNSGNLYAFENPNTGDPASWDTGTTLVTGSTDTTRHVEIISSRNAIPDNIVSVVFELQMGNTFDLYTAMKPAGSSTWGAMETWVVPSENKWATLYSMKVNGNQVFRSVFQRSVEQNLPPYNLRYKYYDGSIWQESGQVSDDAFSVTGLQKPEVGDLDGSTPVFAYAGINFIGVYFDNFTWIPTTVENEVTPISYSIEQNYPNPFNPSTSIKYSVPQNSIVTIKIYDVIGNEVATLVNGAMDTGNHEVSFDGKNLSSGVYFYKMEALPINGDNSFVQTKKMMLIK